MIKRLIICFLFIIQEGEALDPTYLVSDFSTEDLSKMPTSLEKVAKYCSIRKFNLAEKVLKHFFIEQGLEEEFLHNSANLLRYLKKYSLTSYKFDKRHILWGVYSSKYPVTDYVYYNFLNLFMWARTPTDIIEYLKHNTPNI